MIHETLRQEAAAIRRRLRLRAMIALIDADLATGGRAANRLLADLVDAGEAVLGPPRGCEAPVALQLLGVVIVEHGGAEGLLRRWQGAARECLARPARRREGGAA